LYAVPTTSGPGSEASKFCLVLDTGKKKKLEIVSSRIIPEMIFIDPLLATSMPPELTASCGMDALSNSVEAYFSTRANPLTDAKSIHALRLISESLRTAVANGKNLQAREKMALASFEAGLAFTNTHSGAVHALGHPLAGMFGIPEGVSNAILLPHVMRYSLNASLDRMVDVAEAMGETVWGLSKRDAAEKAIGAIKRLIVDIGLPTTLGKVGIKKDAIVAMSRQAQEDSLLETSPFVLKTRDIEQIYEDAFVEYPPPVFQAPPPVSPSTH
ncbi:MAG TPA: iron-containing alcohol dehydrogenase, partial [Nitrospiria bacterium]